MDRAVPSNALPADVAIALYTLPQVGAARSVLARVAARLPEGYDLKWDVDTDEGEVTSISTCEVALVLGVYQRHDADPMTQDQWENLEESIALAPCGLIFVEGGPEGRHVAAGVEYVGGIYQRWALNYTASQDVYGWSVRGASGEVWRPDDDTTAAITADPDPYVAALYFALCVPGSGTWHS